MRALPPILAEIAEVTDEETAWLIAGAVGGRRVLVPSRPGINWLTQLVGDDKAAAIIARLGPSIHIDMPNGKLRTADPMIGHLLDAGHSVPAIAQKLGITERAVRRHRQRRRAVADHTSP